MSIKKSEFDKVAHLAALEFDEDRALEYQSQFNKILSYFDKLKEIKTDNVEPLVTPHGIASPLRKDKVENQIDRESLLESAPDVKDSLYKVPPVVG